MEENEKAEQRMLAHAGRGFPLPGRLGGYDREEIRAAFAAGVSVEKLAAEYERSTATIRRILRGGTGAWSLSAV